MTFVYTGVEQLNEHLATRSFIEGWSLSKADSSVLKYISNDIDHDAHPHVARWSALVASFPPCLRARWPGEEVASEAQEEVAEEAEDAGDEEAAEATEEAAPAAEGEDEVDFEMDFGDDLNDEGDDAETKEKMAKVAEQVKAIQARQKGKAGDAKSNVTLDVKPADDETDLAAMEAAVRAIEMDGLKWLGGQLIDVAYGIKKLRILCQIVDVKISSPDIIVEEIESIEDVQSCDIFAFQMA